MSEGKLLIGLTFQQSVIREERRGLKDGGRRTSRSALTFCHLPPWVFFLFFFFLSSRRKEADEVRPSFNLLEKVSKSEVVCESARVSEYVCVTLQSFKKKKRQRHRHTIWYVIMLVLLEFG